MGSKPTYSSRDFFKGLLGIGEICDIIVESLEHGNRKNLSLASNSGAKMVYDRVLYYWSGCQGFWRREFSHTPTDEGWVATAPNTTRILRWEGSIGDLSGQYERGVCHGLLHLLMVSQSLRRLEVETFQSTISHPIG